MEGLPLTEAEKEWICVGGEGGHGGEIRERRGRKGGGETTFEI